MDRYDMGNVFPAQWYFTQYKYNYYLHIQIYLSISLDPYVPDHFYYLSLNINES